MQRQRRLLGTAILAGLGLASFRTAAAQPQPFQDDPPRYRSNRPYETEADRRAAQRQAERPAEPRDAAPAEEPAAAQRSDLPARTTEYPRDERRHE
jgi:hypothetical protein